MELISTFDFIDMFPEGKSLAIVGNAGALKGQGFGKVIDSFDVVARFNECVLSGFEDDVGSKTSILVANPYAETRSKPISASGTPDVVFIISPQTRRGDKGIFLDWVGENRVLFTYTPTLIGVTEADHKAGLTTGTYAVHLLPRILKPSRVLLTGFTMFKGPSHYWQDGTPGGVKSHDFDRESEIFINIINNCKHPVVVTPEVWGVQENTKNKFLNHVKCFDAELL